MFNNIRNIFITSPDVLFKDVSELDADSNFDQILQQVHQKNSIKLIVLGVSGAMSGACTLAHLLNQTSLITNIATTALSFLACSITSVLTDAEDELVNSMFKKALIKVRAATHVNATLLGGKDENVLNCCTNALKALKRQKKISSQSLKQIREQDDNLDYQERKFVKIIVRTNNAIKNILIKLKHDLKLIANPTSYQDIVFP